MYNKFIQWLLPKLIGKRTVIVNARIRGEILLDTYAPGSMVLDCHVDRRGLDTPR